EQGVERGPRVRGVRLRTAGGRMVAVGAELLRQLGDEQRTLVAGALLGDARRQLGVPPALPAAAGVEARAVGTGVQVGAAACAGRVGGQEVGMAGLDRDLPLGAAGGTAEDVLGRGAEAAAPRPLGLRARRLRAPRPRRRAALAAVLVAPLPVLAVVGHRSP